MLQNMSLGKEWYIQTLGRVTRTWFSSWTCVCSIWPCPLMFEWWCHEMRGFWGLAASCYTTVCVLGQHWPFGKLWVGWMSLIKHILLITVYQTVMTTNWLSVSYIFTLTLVLKARFVQFIMSKQYSQLLKDCYWAQECRFEPLTWWTP